MRDEPTKRLRLGMVLVGMSSMLGISACDPLPPPGGVGDNPCAAVLCPTGTECVVLDTHPPQARCVEIDEPPPPPPSDDPCASVRCPSGTHCEAKDVVCVRAPCPPVAECVPDEPPPMCGGIAGIPCPGEGICKDDPSDDCNPRRGGADCGGICTCPIQAACIEGFVWDDSPQVCACVPREPQACGKVTCDQGLTCCNASCGICVPPGGACIQIACE